MFRIPTIKWFVSDNKQVSSDLKREPAKKRFLNSSVAGVSIFHI